MGYFTETIHTLVCLAFHGPKPTPKHQVAHKDCNKMNNGYLNLRWATPKENIADSIILGRFKGRKRKLANY